MAKSDNLRIARQAKQDEFYTKLADIENELKHYKSDFFNKIVFCNCDDPFESNFFKYFAMNFNRLGLKKLICTSYATSPVAWTQLSLFENENVILKTVNGKQSYKIEITEVKDYNGDGAVDLADVEYLLKNKKNSLAVLNGDGDFRSEECIALLKQSDIVVTNPPFSLFREYVAQLIEYNKKFIIIGNQNAIAYKEIFPLIRDEKIWLGYKSGAQEFFVPQTFVKNNVYTNEKGERVAKFGNICWFTNVDTKKRHEIMTLYKKYKPEEYPAYDNFDAVNVATTADIPYDYNGIMGVPITFMDKYNPEQFEIIGMGTGDTAKSVGVRKNYRGRTDLSYTVNGKQQCPYNRILIRRKQK